MDKRTLGEEVTKELAVKATIWGPAIAGAVLLGPLGIIAGLVTSVAIIASGSSGSAPPAGGDPSKE